MSGQQNSESGTSTDQDDSAPAGDGWVMGAWSPESFESALTPAAPPADDESDDEAVDRVDEGPDNGVADEVDAVAVGTDGTPGDAAPVDAGSAAQAEAGAAAPVDEKAAEQDSGSQGPGRSEPATVRSASSSPAAASPAAEPFAGTPLGRPSGPPPEGPPADEAHRFGGPQTGAPPLGRPRPGDPRSGEQQYRGPQQGGPPQGSPQYGGPPQPGPAPAPARVRPRPDAASAAELTEDAIVRHRSDRPSQGWRGGLFRMSGGLLNPGIGPVEKARQEQLRRIRRPLPGSHQIAVSSIKGGVGKTSVSACLGLVLAENRGDRVIALDANPDAGTLADRLTAETSVTVRHLLDNIEATHSLTDVARYTSLAGRLQVLASEQDPAMSEAFNRDEYERVCAVLTRFYNIVITDSGTGLVHSAMEGTLALADSLVVVGAPTVDGASRASKTLDWLIAHGHAAQVANAIVVLSCDRTSKEVDRSRVRSHFEARCRAVVEVPHDPHLATGGRIELCRLRPPTHDAFLSLAAQLADGFGQHGRRVEPEPEQIPSLG